MSRHQSHPEYLRAAYLRCCEMRDRVREMRLELEAAKAPMRERLALAQVAETVDTWAAYYWRELGLLARRGGQGTVVDRPEASDPHRGSVTALGGDASASASVGSAHEVRRPGSPHADRFSLLPAVAEIAGRTVPVQTQPIEGAGERV